MLSIWKVFLQSFTMPVHIIPIEVRVLQQLFLCAWRGAEFLKLRKSLTFAPRQRKKAGFLSLDPRSKKKKGPLPFLSNMIECYMSHWAKVAEFWFWDCHPQQWNWTWSHENLACLPSAQGLRDVTCSQNAGSDDNGQSVLVFLLLNLPPLALAVLARHPPSFTQRNALCTPLKINRDSRALEHLLHQG